VVSEPVIEVVVAGLGRPAGGLQQILLVLKERAGPRFLLIGIGAFEAEAIALHVQGIRPARPLTHDLVARLLPQLGGHVRRVEVSGLDGGIFQARLVLQQAGQELELDSRPSDAVALAVRAAVPIYVAEAVLDQAGVVAEEPAAATGHAGPPEEAGPPVDASQLAVYKDFIETLNLEDLDGGGPERPA
jgi:uncharacterized protein